MSSANAATRVGCVVATYNALPWLEQALESVRALETVVVDNGSTDGTVAFVRERFPNVTLITGENRGLCAGWNTGLSATTREHVVLLNADAWLVDGAIDELLAAADRHPRAAAVAARLENTDGTLQRSVRGFPSVWRLATEYLYLRKLAPRSRVFNAFYGAGFSHDEERAVDWAMGACFMVRRAAYNDVGTFDDRFFMFSEEVEWYRRAADRGWSCVFAPTARCVHVGGASHGGRLFRENIRGHLRYLLLHGGPRSAERARRVMRAGLLVRSLVLRGEGRARARAGAAWLASGSAETLVDSPRA